MAGPTSTKLLRAFEKKRGVPGFLSNFFTLEQEGLINSEEVEWHVSTSGRQLSVALPGIDSGARENQANVWTKKKTRPPVHKERITITAAECGGQAFGRNPYDEPNVLGVCMLKLEQTLPLLTAKIRRSDELQAAQILQTGAITLPDDIGGTAFSNDYGMRAAHKITVTTSWSAAGGTPINDVENAIALVKRNAGRQVKDIVFGVAAWNDFRNNAQQLQLSNNLLWTSMFELGGEAPASTGTMNETGTFCGYMTVAGARVRMWVYDAVYEHPQTGTETAYLGTNNVLLIAEADRRIIIGNIPRLVAPDPRLAAVIPPQLSTLGAGGFGLATYGYAAQDGSAIIIEVGCRPLLIPVDLDSFAVIDTTA